MKKFLFKTTCSFILFGLMSYEGNAQDTYTTVYNLFQAKCSTSGCHSGSTPAGGLALDGSANTVYNAIINTSPTNTTAATKGNKLVDPGMPYNSFLLRKVGYHIDSFFDLEASEDDNIHATTTPLANYEMELIRQWIFMGAPKTQNVVDYQVLQDYYTNGGAPFLPTPTAPDPADGFLVRFGPLFYNVGEEKEFMKKERLKIPANVEVYSMSADMSASSHHMLLFKYDNSSSGTRDGMRLVGVTTGTTPFDGNTSLTGAWQYSGAFDLPTGTSFFWDAGTVLDFDYHVRNYGTTILPADFYLTVKTRPRSPSTVEMHAELVNNAVLTLSQGQNTRTANHIPGGGDRYLWMISSHTHKYGVDYDIYLRNPDGSRGTQIYEGYFNQEYTFNQHYYNWEHPAIRFMEPLFKFNGSDGMIYEVKWNVTGPCTSILYPIIPSSCVTFGLTTEDEMMLFTYLYTNQPVSGVPTSAIFKPFTENTLAVSPNPFKDAVNITYSLAQKSNVQLEIYDLVGKKIQTVVDAQQDAGNFEFPVHFNEQSSNGIYFVRLTIDGKTATRKVVELK